MERGEVEQFISQAKAAGAQADTTIEDITDDRDPSLTLGWRLQVPGVQGAAPMAAVPMPHRLMWDLQSLWSRSPTVTVTCGHCRRTRVPSAESCGRR
ncbi:hypothetical protein BGM19_38970 [Streptomyces agglomeratus]|nr:hypothetical protein BGM19_38970 [Streptomyces agglomeratus]